ncbi:membrane protein insertion efficiency factor YidD [Gimesia sp.]|uniref:membrane protein insertion efficiency factor YidD n=1 Tax=Gimesia sp. TaxID=2024833 RepID=UPI003A9025C5
MKQIALQIGRILYQLPARTLIGLVRIYQMTLSHLIGRQCRFHPTCSEYFIQAVKKYGAIRGSCKGFLRICRCHPFHPGGYDPP